VVFLLEFVEETVLGAFQKLAEEAFLEVYLQAVPHFEKVLVVFLLEFVEDPVLPVVYLEFVEEPALREALQLEFHPFSFPPLPLVGHLL